MYSEVNDMPNCANCGILIPCNALVFDHHGYTLYSCSTRCQRVYREYTFPRHSALIEEREANGDADLRFGYAGASAATVTTASSGA